MHINQKQKQIGDLIKSNIKLKQLQSCGDDELNQVIMSKQSPFSSGGQINVSHHTPQNVFNSYSNNSGSGENDRESSHNRQQQTTSNNNGCYFVQNKV